MSGWYYVCICVYSYTEHSTVGLAQQWDQLDQLCMRMQHNLEQQIQAWSVLPAGYSFYKCL